MKKIVFIDRDGVINKDPGGWTEHSYVTRWKDFHFIRDAKKAIRSLSTGGFDLILISNQGGVSKGFFTEERLDSINSRMLEEIRKAGGRIKKTYYCVHQSSDECDCRKPEIGMFKKAAKESGAGIKGSFFVGDGKVDVEAGHKAGLKTILVLSGKTPLSDVDEWSVKPDHMFKDLAEAAKFIIESYKNSSLRASRRRAKQSK